MRARHARHASVHMRRVRMHVDDYAWREARGAYAGMHPCQRYMPLYKVPAATNLLAAGGGWFVEGLAGRASGGIACVQGAPAPAQPKARAQEPPAKKSKYFGEGDAKAARSAARVEAWKHGS